MSQFAANVVLINGPEYLRDNVTIAFVCKSPLKSDTRAQIVTKSFASVSFSTSDVSITTNGDNVLLATNPKSDLDPSDSATAGEDTAIVFCSGSEVLGCLDVTDRIITNADGDRIGFPAGQVTINNWS